MRKAFVVGAFVALLGLFCVVVVQADEQRWCPLCSMDLKMYWKTNHYLTFSDGKKVGYCSIHCASIAYQERPADIDRWEVVDYDTQQLMDARKAHFLIGSGLPGTMTPVSKLAFASADVAGRYQKQHGGTIGTLDDALKQAIEGRGEDMAMIKQKAAKMAEMGRDLAAKHGCYGCHGQGGTGGRGPAWNAKEFAGRMDSRVKIKQTILTGKGEMPKHEGKIPENDLHAITIYIWAQRPQQGS